MIVVIPYLSRPGWSTAALSASKLWAFNKVALPLGVAICLEELQIQAMTIMARETGKPFLPRICSRTPMDCVHQWPLDAAACDLLFMLTCAILMTSSESKAGALGSVAVSAHSLMLQVLFFLGAIEMGVMAATSVRVGFHLGKNDVVSCHSVDAAVATTATAVTMVAAGGGWYCCCGSCDYSPAFTINVTTTFLQHRVRVQLHRAHRLPATHAIMQRKAKQVGVMAMVVSGFVGVVVAASIYLLRNDVGQIFTSNATVVDEAAGICGLTSAGFSVLSIFYVMYGILQGQARSGMISVVFVVGVSESSHPPHHPTHRPYI